MRRKLNLIFTFSFCFLLAGVKAQSQDSFDFKDSLEFVEFLVRQKTVPGLTYQLVLPIKGAERIQILTIDSLWTMEDGLYISPSFDSIASVLALRDSLAVQDSIVADLKFLIYEEENPQEAASAFVANLLRSNDIFPLEEPIGTDEDLVALANQSPFQPDYKIGFGYFNDFKIFMITVIIVLFLTISLSMIVFMVIFKTRRNRLENRRNAYREEIAGPLSEILFNFEIEEIAALTEEELNNFFPKQNRNKALYNEVLIENIISLNKKMKGDFKEKLKTLYRRLGLLTYTQKLLSSKKWDAIAIGLVQINEMDLYELLPQVKSHVNSSNFHIRSGAAAAILNLSEMVDLNFLRDQKYPLSSWQQMNYLRIIKFLYPTRKLVMVNLFDSDNLSVRLFGYKLVRMVGRVDLVEKLGEIFPNVTDVEKVEILKTIKTLGMPGYEEYINDSMKSQNPKLAKTAIKVAGSLGNEDSIAIIISLIQEELSFELKFQLFDSLSKLDFEKFEAICLGSNDEKTKEIYHHIKDPLLSNV